MPLETELKYLDADLDAVRDTLHALGAHFQARRFESNVVFDDDDRSLKARGVLVRLRDDGRHILTLKRPPEGPTPEGVKAWEEDETEVADPGAVGALLAALGFGPAFVYEKVREEWEFMGCHVCLDHLAIGDFVEIEGDPAAIAGAASALGLDVLVSSTANYHQLNREFRQRAGLPPDEGFAFEPGEAERLRRALAGGDASGQAVRRP